MGSPLLSVINIDKVVLFENRVYYTSVIFKVKNNYGIFQGDGTVYSDIIIIIIIIHSKLTS